MAAAVPMSAGGVGVAGAGASASMGGGAGGGVANSNLHYASASLYVGDLAPDVEETTLYETFNAIGPVASIRVCRDTGTRKSLGYAYVNYHTVQDAERALNALNYAPVKGVPCRIMWCHRDPSLRRSGAGNIFVKNLDEEIDNKALYDTFSLFGNILSCKVATDEAGKSLGYGFVHYESEEAANEAIAKVNGMRIGRKAVYVGPFKKRSERIEGRVEVFTNLYVKHLPDAWDEAKLRDVFGAYGEITSLAINVDNKNRRFAFVNFAEPSSAKRAVEELHGKEVQAEEAVQVAVEKEVDETEKKENSPSSSGDVNVEKKEEDVKETSITEAATTEKTAAEVEGTVSAAAETTTAPGTSTQGEESKENKEVVKEEKLAGDGNETASSSAVKQDGEGEETKTKSQEKSAATSTMVTPVSRDILGESIPYNCLYVQRAMTKAERMSRLRDAFSSTASSETAAGRGINLYVKNLGERVTDDALRAAFSKFGTVTSVKVMRDAEGVSKGFGFVCFAFPEDATKAVTTMHLKIFQGKPLYVGLAEKRDHRVARLQQRYRVSAAAAAAHHNPRAGPPPMMMMPPHAGAPMPPPTAAYPAAMMYPGPRGGVSASGPVPTTQAAYAPWTTRGPVPPPQNQYPSLFPPAAGVSGYQQPPPPMPMHPHHQMAGVPGGPSPMGPGPMMQPHTRSNNNSNNPMNRRPMAVGGGAAGATGGPSSHFKFTPQVRNQRNVPVGEYGVAPQGDAAGVAAAGGPGGVASMVEMPPLSAKTLAAANPQLQKQMLGERLYPLVARQQPDLAGKITGMMLEMDNTELLSLLEDETQLISKVDEALVVLHRHAQAPPQQQQ